MDRIIKIKNMQYKQDVYAGQMIKSLAYHTITNDAERRKFAEDNKVNSHIKSSKLVINNGYDDLPKGLGLLHLNRDAVVTGVNQLDSSPYHSKKVYAHFDDYCDYFHYDSIKEKWLSEETIKNTFSLNESFSDEIKNLNYGDRLSGSIGTCILRGSSTIIGAVGHVVDASAYTTIRFEVMVYNEKDELIANTERAYLDLIILGLSTDIHKVIKDFSLNKDITNNQSYTVRVKKQRGLLSDVICFPLVDIYTKLKLE